MSIVKSKEFREDQRVRSVLASEGTPTDLNGYIAILARLESEVNV